MELMGHKKVLLEGKKVDIGNEVHDSETRNLLSMHLVKGALMKMTRKQKETSLNQYCELNLHSRCLVMEKSSSFWVMADGELSSLCPRAQVYFNVMSFMTSFIYAP